MSNVHKGRLQKVHGSRSGRKFKETTQFDPLASSGIVPPMFLDAQPSSPPRPALPPPINPRATKDVLPILLRSGLAKSARPVHWRSRPGGDVQSRPPWDKRHHLRNEDASDHETRKRAIVLKTLAPKEIVTKQAVGPEQQVQSDQMPDKQSSAVSRNPCRSLDQKDGKMDLGLDTGSPDMQFSNQNTTTSGMPAENSGELSQASQPLKKTMLKSETMPPAPQPRTSIWRVGQPARMPESATRNSITTNVISGLLGSPTERLDVSTSLKYSTVKGKADEPSSPGAKDDGAMDLQQVFLMRRMSRKMARRNKLIKKSKTCPPRSGGGKTNEAQNEEINKQIHERSELIASRKAAMLAELLSGECFVPFTQEEKDVLHGFFELHDEDGSQSLSLTELMCVVDDIGRAPAEGSQDALQFESLMHKADADGSGELNFSEFTNFLAEYYQSVYARLFVDNDQDASGTITRFELKGLMVKVKECGFKVRGEDIVNVFSEIDMGGDGVLDWQEFCAFMCSYRKLEYDLLKVSAGFTPVELDYLETIFQAADKDLSGQLEIKEVGELLETRMIGSEEDVQEEIGKMFELFSRMDKDQSLTLDQLEFVRLLRVWSNNGKYGKQSILKLFKDGEEGTKAFIQRSVKKAASCAISDAEAKAVFAQKLYATATEHDLENGILSTTYNLTLEEVRTLRESFEYSDIDGSGFIDPGELGLILKDLGVTPTTAPQKKAFSYVRGQAEFRGNLGFPFLVKFLVKYQNTCVEEVLQSLKDDESSENAGEEREGVPVQKLVKALYQQGQYMQEDEATALLQKVGGNPFLPLVEKSVFLKMVEAARMAKLRAWRGKCGFSDSQLALIRHAFTEHSEQKGSRGYVMNRDESVLKALQLLNLAPPANKQEQLLHALLRVDREGVGIISFQDFLILARHLENQKLYKRTLEERRLGFDADAVQQFRQVFNDCEPDAWGKVGIPRIFKLFGDLGVVKDSKQRKQLKHLIDEITSNDKSGIEFVQFLNVLRSLESQGVC
eukprot:gnl/MRDRNA2_/MRDRNA2_114982_c0_seq1.p1 gnl/MRDRNA2_/MRDRNA2_114982_c0~~gnl/MRDRNA2_/MRDRNA2_114982_c0_seq1.p1  ORF type:complete len:1014 (+),score=231.61 gnl/MRDRNA2_/MRDRNA2_114982_c0_seq1:64-3105(+)